MHPMIETMINRRSIRKYLPEQISDRELEQVIQAGLYAANGGNHQYARFLVIQHPEVLVELARVVREELAAEELIEGRYQNKSIIKAKNQPDYNFMFHAPTLIVAKAPRTWLNQMADCACALQNMQVAAAALGLGSCWVNQVHWLTDRPSVRRLLAAYDLTEEEDVQGCIVLGRPDQSVPAPPPRREGRVTTVR